jgi:L-ascorbate 6-phosphate lactonase
MVHSTWDDWLVRSEIEAAEPDGLSLWFLGCNGFVLRTPEATVYVDPYFGDGNPPGTVRMIPVPMDPADATECDAVLATHEHIDHMHPPSYGPLVEDLGADLYAPGTSFDDPDYDGPLQAPESSRNRIEPGDAFEVGDLTVHVRESHDPDSLEPVSYVFEHESGTVFHGGDSKPAGEFAAIGREFDIDVGILAFGTRGNVADPDGGAPDRVSWYMHGDQVIEAANDLRIDRLLPTHYDMWNGVDGDRKVIFEHARSHEYPRRIDPIRIGDRVDLDEPGITLPRSLRA